MIDDWLRFYAHTFAGEFLDHIPIVAALVLLAVIVAGGLRGLGVPYLFWHERNWPRAVAGFATGVVVTMTFFVSFLIDARDCEREIAICPAFEWIRGWPGGWYFFGCLVSLVISLAALSLLPAVARLLRLVPEEERRRERRKWVGHGRWPLFVFAFAIGLATSSAIWWLTERGPLGRLLGRLDFIEVMIVGDSDPFPAGHRLAAIAVAALALTMLVGTVRKERWAPAAVSICVLLALVIAADGFLAYALGEAAIVAIVLIGCLLLLAGRVSYRVKLKALHDLYGKPVSFDPSAWQYDEPEAPSYAQPAWTRGKPTLVLVAVSGGGLRAALWTAAVLTELEMYQRTDGTPLLTPWNIALMTGASGGMVGATYYTLSLERSDLRHAWKHVVTAEALLAAVAEDSLSDVAQRMVFHDVPAAFWPTEWSPIPTRWRHGDRGTRLDETLARHLGDRMKAEAFREIPATIAAMRPFELEGLYPTLAYTPMLIEDGRRLFISNADLERLATSYGPALNQSRRLYSRNAIEVSRLIQRSLELISPWTAARLSASFPYVTPAPVLPTVPRRRVVDAGYWDNYGVNLCSSWLEDALISAKRREWLGSSFGNVLLLQIRDGVLAYSAEQAPSKADEHSRALARGIEWLSSPPEAVLAARDAVTIYRGDEQVESLADEFGASFTTAVVEFGRSASLSWSLTSDEVTAIRQAAHDKVTAIGRPLESFLTAATAPIRRPVGFHSAT